MKKIKDILIFVLAPVIGLIYVVFMPFVGLVALGWTATKITVERQAEIRKLQIEVDLWKQRATYMGWKNEEN